MKLRQPGAVQAPCLGGIDQFQALAKRVGLAAPLAEPELHENSEMHG